MSQRQLIDWAEKTNIELQAWADTRENIVISFFVRGIFLFSFVPINLYCRTPLFREKNYSLNKIVSFKNNLPYNVIFHWSVSTVFDKRSTADIVQNGFRPSTRFINFVQPNKNMLLIQWKNFRTPKLNHSLISVFLIYFQPQKVFSRYFREPKIVRTCVRTSKNTFYTENSKQWLKVF